MRIIKYIILAVIALGLMIIALANREAMTMQLLPAELSRLVGVQYEVTLPVFIVILGAVFAGLALGFIWEWLRETKYRSTAASERRERVRLEREVERIAPSTKPGDDVLAILDGR